MSADQALAATDGGAESRRAGSEAEEFLREKLGNGPVPAKEGEEHARALGIAPMALKRARKKLGVIAEKAGLKEGWTWRLPSEGGQKSPKGVTSKGWYPSASDDPLRESDPPKEALDDHPGIPEFLRRPPPAAAQPNGNAAALGPGGPDDDMGHLQ
jgi:hypothetical protein